MIALPIGSGRNGVVSITGQYANRHALIAGATGTGKTTTLATMVESFSAVGTPALIMDVKGDLAGLARANPVDHLDPFTNAQLDLWRLGPDLIARALDLSDAQAGTVEIVFAIADAESLPLSSLADLRDVLNRLAADPKRISAIYGLVSVASVAAVQRAVLRLEREAADAFGPAALDIANLEQRTVGGRGHIAVMSCDQLSRTPGLYAAMCAFILTDLYDRLPEVGDLAAPRLAVVLDEAHLIFDGAPAPLVRRLEGIVRLIRSKGVALVFATQAPSDLPSSIAGQLQNRIQHGLRGVTPADQRAIRAAADSLPRADDLDPATLIGTLGVGAALVSVVGPGGVPGPAELVQIKQSRARLGPLDAQERPVVVKPVAWPSRRDVVSSDDWPVDVPPLPPRKPWSFWTVTFAGLMALFVFFVACGMLNGV